MPKVPELALTLSQKTIIKTWIEQGAMNTDIVKDMLDTSHISYKTDIAPIFEIHCRGCHNEYDHAGHFDATNLDHLRGYASDGTLIGVIVHDNGYQSMPRNADTLGPALLPNDISRIRSWINKGMLNN